MEKYSEKKQVDIAKTQYFEFSENAAIEDFTVRTKAGEAIGKLIKIHTDIGSYENTGLYAIEVLESDGDVTLLFRGAAVIY